MPFPRVTIPGADFDPDRHREMRRLRDEARAAGELKARYAETILRLGKWAPRTPLTKAERQRRRAAGRRARASRRLNRATS